MWRILRVVGYAIGGGIALGVLVFISGLLIAGVLGESGQALGMIVPMVLVPTAFVVGPYLAPSRDSGRCEPRARKRFSYLFSKGLTCSASIAK